MFQNVQSRLTNSAKAFCNFIPVVVWDNRNMALFYWGVWGLWQCIGITVETSTNKPLELLKDTCVRFTLLWTPEFEKNKIVEM